MPKRKPSYVSALSPEYALLGLLAQRPSHGYELHQRLANDLGQIWHISLSQTYNILKRLEQRGFIRPEMQEQERLPARRLYTLKAAGKKRFENWLLAPSGCSVRAIRVEFTTRLYFASARDPELAGQLIANQIAEVHNGLARLRNKLERLPGEQVFNQLGLELRIRQLESILRWLDECRRLLIETPVGQKREPI
jgi:DNA-binding PadR family transcriptional regulator